MQPINKRKASDAPADTPTKERKLIDKALGPASDCHSAWSKYWRALNEINEANHVLTLPAGVFFIGSKDVPSQREGSVLYVRDCFAEYVRRMCEAKYDHAAMVRPEATDNREVVLTGTPGTGKTLFRNYFAWYLAHHVAGKLAIVFHRSPSQCNMVMLIRDANGATSVRFSPDPSTLYRGLDKSFPIYYLGDVSQGNSEWLFDTDASTDHDFHFFMFTSPNEAAYSHKETEGALVLYMRAWTEQELLGAAAAAPLHRVSADTVRKRFAKHGGVACAVLDNTTAEVHENLINRAIASLSPLKKYLVVDNVGVPGDSNVFYQLPNADCTEYSLVWGSQHLLDLATDRMIALLKQPTQDMFPGFGQEPQGIRSVLFERVCHRLLQASKAFDIVRCGHQSNDIVLPRDPPTEKEGRSVYELRVHDAPPRPADLPLNVSDAGRLIAAAPVGTYLQPTASTFPFVHSIYKWDANSIIGFQMKVSASHPTGDKAQESFRAMLCEAKVQTLHLVFIPPKSTYHTFAGEVLADHWKDQAERYHIKVLQYSLDISR